MQVQEDGVLQFGAEAKPECSLSCKDCTGAHCATRGRLFELATIRLIGSVDYRCRLFNMGLAFPRIEDRLHLLVRYISCR